MFLRQSVRLPAWIAALFVAYVWLTFVLRRFTFTQPWGDPPTD